MLNQVFCIIVGKFSENITNMHVFSFHGHGLAILNWPSDSFHLELSDGDKQKYAGREQLLRDVRFRIAQTLKNEKANYYALYPQEYCQALLSENYTPCFFHPCEPKESSSWKS